MSGKQETNPRNDSSEKGPQKSSQKKPQINSQINLQINLQVRIQTGLRIVAKLLAWFLPVIWIVSIAFGEFGLGPEPFDTLNSKFGQATIYLLLANLYVGFLIFFWRPLPRSLAFLVKVRRSWGVACFFYATLHLASYVLREGSLEFALSEMTQRTYLIAGSLAWITLLLLALTSNDFSLRKLKMKNWRRLHKLVYVALILIAVHQLSIEKINVPQASWLFIPIGVLYCVRLVVQQLRSRRSKV